MALALAPSGADAPAAVFLLGEAREGVAATLGRGVWTGVTGCPALTWPPSSGPFPPPPTQPAGHPPVLSKPGGLEQGGPERRLWVHSLVAWAACPGSNGPGASGWVAGDARAWGAAAGAGRGPGPRRWALQCGALGLRPRPGGGRARSPRGAGPALGGGARRLQGCPAAPDGRWWRGAPPGLAPPGSCPPRPVPAHLGLPGSARCLVPSAEICPGPRGTRKVACWAGGPSPGPGGSAITWTAYMGETYTSVKRSLGPLPLPSLGPSFRSLVLKRSLGHRDLGILRKMLCCCLLICDWQVNPVCLCMFNSRSRTKLYCFL